MSRIPYTFTRNSIAAVINPLAESRLVQAGIPVVGYPGVRGGGGFLIMPAVTQIFYDNYLSNQTLDATLGSPWSVAGTGAKTVRDEHTLSGYSCELVASVSNSVGMYQTYQTASVMTVSAFVYAPPPARVDKLHLYYGNAGNYSLADGIISLGGYWYFVWKTATGQNSASDYWGVVHVSGIAASIWVSCLSLTQTAAPVGFVPNSQTDATQASADDNLKFTLAEPLPQSGSISFVYIPFYDNDGSAVDGQPHVVCFLRSGQIGTDSYLIIAINDGSSAGIFVSAMIVGGSDKNTAADGYGGTGFKAFEPVEIVVDWDFAAGGTKLVRIWANGELQVESDNLVDGFPTGLVDMWVGVQRSAASTWIQHGQGGIQDIQIHRR